MAKSREVSRQPKKRKWSRSRSRSRSLDIDVPRNPFFCFETSEAHSEDGTLSVVLSFLDESEGARLQRATDGSLLSDAVTARVLNILSLLEDGNSLTLSTEEVSSLLIPWAAKCLVFLSAGEDQWEADLELLWRTLASSLKFVIVNSCVVRGLSHILSQQVMNKLVPFAMQSVMASSTSCIGTHAATSFTLLTEHLYRPKIDLFCNTLLASLAGHVESPELPKNENLSSIVLASLQLLRSLQSQGLSSPKKNFQVLSAEHVLLALAKLTSAETRELIENILWDGFFHPQHHIEGFASMKLTLPDESSSRLAEDRNSSVFRCYQVDLIKSIWSIFQKEQMTGNEATAMSGLIVLLVEGFFVQTSVWHKNFRNRAKGKEKSESSISTLQFRFWGNLAGAMLLKVECLESVEGGMSHFASSLTLLLQKNVYHPTFEDKDHYHFSFLVSLSKRLLTLVERNKSKEALVGLECMVQLNHLLMHSELVKVVTLAAQSTTSGNCDNFHRFLCTLFDTYQQLRQLDFLVHTLVSVLSSAMQNDSDKSAVPALCGALKSPNVRRTISSALACAPPGQTQVLFETFNACIVEELQRPGRDTQRSSILVDSISLVVSLFVLLLRNLRVDEYTSVVILSHCQEALSGCGVTLLSKLGSNMSELQLARDGIYLSGWIIDLQNRCLFWSGTSDVEELSSVQHPAVLMSLLNDLGRETTPYAHVFVYAWYELQFLACYRIHQLHSLLHQKQITLDSSESPGMEELLCEVTRLVEFVVSVAEKTESAIDGSAEARDPWIILSAFLPTWTPYCDASHIKSFAQWMISALDGLGDKQIMDGKSTKRLFLPKSEDCMGSRNAALALLHDASFLETERLVSEFFATGLLHVRALVVSASSAPNELDYLRASIRIIKVLKAGRCYSREPNARADTMNMIFDLESSVIALDVDLVEADQSAREFLQLDLVAAIRSLLNKFLLENDSWTEDKLTERCAVLMINVMITTTKLSESTGVDGESFHFQNFLFSSASLVQTLSSRCFGQDGGPSVEAELDKSIQSSRFEWNAVSLHLMRACVKGAAMRIEVEATSDFAGFLLESVMSNQVEPLGEVLLLAGDLLSLSGSETRVECMRLISEHITSGDVSSNNFRHLSGIMAQQPVLEEGVAQRIINHFLASFQGSIGLFEATILCKLMARVPLHDFRCFLEQLLASRYVDGDTGAYHILRVLLGATEGRDRRQIIAEFGQLILGKSIDNLSASHRTCSGSLDAAAGLVIELTNHKDLIVMKERDIARLLSQINCLLQDRYSRATNLGDADIFPSSCAVVMSLVQRFPKQLYTCVPSLMLSLQRLFGVVLHGSSCANEITEQTRDFGRLCEFIRPHKEILRKHILGLIVDFVDALRDDMLPIRKKLLTTSVYSLLDMLSEYEVSQLNSLLDTTSKALFRSFYEGFQKWHVYKGRS